MSKPLVSVVIPLYNREKYIGAAIQSVLRQDYQPIEVIVVDDGSTDRSGEIAKSFKEVRYFHQPHLNAGPALARNTGIKQSKGELISFLDDDDIFLPQKIRLQVDYLKANPTVGYVLCRLKNILETGIPYPNWLNEDDSTYNYLSFLPSTLMVRRFLFDTIGLFDTRFTLGDDTDWFLRTKEADIQMAVLPEVLLERRIHNTNLMHLLTNTSGQKNNLLKIVKATIDRKKKTGTASVVS